MISDDVRRFYNRYPYPFADLKNNSNINGANLFGLLEYEIRTDGFKGKTFLDAGCGSGHRTLDIAKKYPNAKFFGFDFSEKSIELAKRQAAKDNVKNVTFENHDIYEYETDQLFDIIIANGVISHLSEPELGIKNLTRFLKKEGLFVGWVFHTYGEFNRILQRNLLQILLSKEKHDFGVGVALIKEMQISISKNRYGKSFGAELTENDELSKNADAFLNPQVLTFTFKEAINLFRDLELAWASIEQINFDESGYIISLQGQGREPFWMLDIKSLLNSETAYKYYQRLDKIDKLRVIELITKPRGFTIFAGKHKSIAMISKRIRTSCIKFRGAEGVE